MSKVIKRVPGRPCMVSWSDERILTGCGSLLGPLLGNRFVVNWLGRFWTTS